VRAREEHPWWEREFFFGMATAQTASGSGGDCAGVGSGRMDRAAGCCRWLLCRPVGDGAEAGDVGMSNSGRRRRWMRAARGGATEGSGGQRKQLRWRPGGRWCAGDGRRGSANSDGQSTEMKP
jgi:hypothetical protein